MAHENLQNIINLIKEDVSNCKGYVDMNVLEIEDSLSEITIRIDSSADNTLSNVSETAQTFKNNFLNNVAIRTNSETTATIDLDLGVWTLSNIVNGNRTFVLPTPIDGILNQINVRFQTSIPSPVINWGTTLFFTGKTPDISTIGYYSAIWEFDIKQNNWVCGLIKLG